MIEHHNPYKHGGDERHPYKKDGEQPPDPVEEADLLVRQSRTRAAAVAAAEASPDPTPLPTTDVSAEPCGEHDKNAVETPVKISTGNGLTVLMSNDGKERWQSWEARIESQSVSMDGAGGVGNFNAAAWGATKEEARDNLQRLLKEMAVKCLANLSTKPA